MRLLISLLLAGTLASPAFATITDADAINQAGRQRMLSQRMAKAFAQLGQNIEPYLAQKVLGSSMQVFEQQLRTLSSHAPTSEIQSRYTELASLWTRYRVLLGKASTPDTGKQVLQLSDQLLTVAHAATVAWQQHAGTGQAELVNLAGRQRMLSQRMAKLYMFRSWGMTTQRELGALKQAQDEFVAGLGRLESAELTTPRIRQELDLARQQWVFFEMALATEDSETNRRNVATTSERILETMNNITAMYEKLPATRP
ncbi:type IV pili methyl-accepting chemotaxis transducer N-terminal domain-containing protein [Chitinimonas sp. BJYL2]|uniref:type IV pili methyl-accepting chemotaxis transducer N-terminal domain-containing protein n=1 Tax=Chitinimonas sp. BJYL2 TaxID=2976696 RepID=UPI0022B5A3BC|nr:type IV pili methyl-accepting chemotaxis transducer N-terminal domain-containing protein [Chitinimonas sp. BJYL2]